MARYMATMYLDLDADTYEEAGVIAKRVAAHALGGTGVDELIHAFIDEQSIEREDDDA